MNRTILLASAAAALILGGVAIAQTAPQSQAGPATSQERAAPAAADTMTRSDNATSDRSMSQAPAAGAYGSDTAAQSADTTSADATSEASMRAGERG